MKLSGAGSLVLENAMYAIFSFEQDRYQRGIDDLIRENEKLILEPCVAFNYKGRDYSLHGLPVSRSTILHNSLIERMIPLDQTRQTLEIDEKLVVQGLEKALAVALNLQDMRDTLPECVVAAIPKILGGLPRVRLPGCTLQSNPRDHRQYLKIVTKIEMYCGLRFLY